jgi:hypothetical protein
MAAKSKVFNRKGREEFRQEREGRRKAKSGRYLLLMPLPGWLRLLR